MPLPFLDKSKLLTSIVSRRGKNVEAKNEVEHGEGVNPDLKMACEEILRAIEHKSIVDLTNAFEAAFEACEAMPHEEAGEEEME